MNHSASPITLLLTALLIVTSLVFFFFGVYTVEGDSMLPNLLPGRNVIILKRFPYDSIHPGDIIVYQSPLDQALVIKRCAGTAGTPVMRNGSAVPVPPRAVFALGDNEPVSRDSRHYGFVAFSSIRGKVIFPRIGGGVSSE